ncbi:MAG: TRAP transporter substrate-binding protein [Elsteraceae bacterium]
MGIQSCSRRSLIAALVCGGLLWAGAASAQTVLKFSHTDTSVGSRQKAAELFAAKTAEYSKGRVTVQIFHSGQLANDPKSLEQLQLGGVDVTVTATGTYATHNKALNLAGMPFLVESYEQGWKFYDESKWLTGELQKLEAKGIRVLATWEAGFRSFTTKAPLNSPADAKGVKMRVFPNDMIRWIMEAIGFTPIVMPVTEVYLALQQGAVAGQENPVDTIYSLRFFEPAPHITLTRHVYSPLPMSIAESTWKRLSPEDREAVSRAAKEAAAYSRKLVQEDEGSQLAEMAAKGAKVSKPAIAPFRAAVESVYDRARGVYGADVDAVLAAAAQVRKELPASN